MTTGIFYTSRAILGKEGQNIIKHLSIMSTKCDVIDHLSNTKTNFAKEQFLKYGNCSIRKSINLFQKFYESDAMNMNSWMEIYDSLDVKDLKDYDNLFIIAGMDLWRSGITRFGKRASVFPNDSGQIKWKSVGMHCINILAILKAHNLYDIPLHEISYDPNEMCCDLFHSDVSPKNNYHVYHGYDIPKYNIKRIDSLQYYFNNKLNDLFFTDKVTDLTFGYTILEKSDREEFTNDIGTLLKKFKSHNFYVKDYQTGNDTTVDKETYLSKLKESRFTYILPSYDRHCFSIYRMIEAVAMDCLPLIHPSCNIEDVSKSFDVNLKDLITNEIPNEKKRLELLEYLKEKMMIVERTFK